MYYFILNPQASSGKGVAVWGKLKPILKERNVPYCLAVFNRREDVSMFVKALTSEKEPKLSKLLLTADKMSEINGEFEYDEVHIVVLGGDGTINLVFNSVVDLKRTKLSCIRVGSGNDFARNLGVYKKPETAFIHLLDEPEEMVLDYGEVSFTPDAAFNEVNDVVLKEQRFGADADRADKSFSGMGKVNDTSPERTRRFIISSGIGYDADICEEVSRSKLKKILNYIHSGKLVYTAIGIRQIFNKDRARVKLYLDDNEPIRIGSLMFAVAMIHEKEGGGVPFCPHADATDGQLELCIVKNAPTPKLLLEVAMVYIRKHILFSNVREMRCKRLHISADRPQWLHTDGETPCKVKEAVLTCRKGLNFVK